MNAIRTEGLTKVFRTPVKQEGLWGSVRSFFRRQYREHIAVAEISLRVEEGEFVGLLGENGAGKTTLVKLLAGLLYPTAGTARVLGYVPWERSNAFRRQFALVMGQRSQLWWDLPAADSFLLNQALYSIPKEQFRRRRDELAERLGIADRLHVQVRRLSLGERMKCEILAALLHAPRLLFLDEPTLGLDIIAQHSVREFLREYNRTHGVTIVLTSHNMDDIEHLCSRVLVLSAGWLVFDGSLEELARRYAEEKLLRVEFATPVDPAALAPFGHLREATPHRAVLSVPRAEVASRAAALLNHFPVTDVTVQELPVEEIVRRLFAQRDGFGNASNSAAAVQ